MTNISLYYWFLLIYIWEYFWNIFSKTVAFQQRKCAFFNFESKKNKTPYHILAWISWNSDKVIWLCWQGSIILIRFERKAGVKDYLGMLLLLGMESINSLKNSYQCYYRYKFYFQIYVFMNHLMEVNGKMCRWSCLRNGKRSHLIMCIG